MNQLDDAVASELRRKLAGSWQEQIWKVYGGGVYPLSKLSVPQSVTDFCDRLNDTDGIPALVMEFERMTLFSDQWIDPGFFTRRAWPKEARSRFRAWQRDARPARMLRLHDTEDSWQFAAKVGGPWSAVGGPNRGISDSNVNSGLWRVMVGYLADHPR